MKLKVAVINNTDPQFFNAKKGEDKGNDVRLSIPDDSTGFLRSMDFIWKVAKCAGIYVRHDLPGGTGCSSSRWLMCYCLFVLLLHLARCLQMGMTFDGSDTFGVTLFSKIIGSTVLLETFLCTIVLSVVTVHWNHCVSVWKRIQQKALFLAPSSQAIDGYSKLNICCKVFPFAMVTLCLFFGAFLIQEACFSEYSDFLALRSKPLTFPSTEARIWLVISGIETAFCASLHLVYTALVVCLAYALAKEFRLFHERLRDTLRDHTKDTINIEQWRLYHNELCRMVSAVDRIACPYIGAILIASTLILCISFYYVIHSEEDSFGLSVAIFTIIMHEMILFSMAGAGIVVNTQVNRFALIAYN